MQRSVGCRLRVVSGDPFEQQGGCPAARREGCRIHRPGPLDRCLEQAILDLSSAVGGTICPSEVARVVGGDDWRPLMERTRRAARRMMATGEVVITQGGRPVGPGFRGPIRISRAD